VADARTSYTGGFNSSTLAMFGRMGIAKGHFDRSVAHQLSDCGLRVASIAELCAKRVPEVMPTEVRYTRNTASSLKCSLDLGELFPCR
jgi:hypothetical protein